MKKQKKHTRQNTKRSVGQQAQRDREMKKRRAHGNASQKTASKNEESKPAKRRSVFGPDGRTNLERMLGLPNPNTPPWPGARKVPHTCYEWY